QRLADFFERPRGIAAGLEPRASDVVDVLALIVLGIEVDPADPRSQPGGAGQHRVRQPPHLPARVVDVELAGHLVSRALQQIRHHVADHSAAAVADVHRPGGIGTDELDHGARALAGVAAAEAVALFPDRAHLAMPDAAGEPQVQAARTGDLDVLDDLLRVLD